MRRSRLAVAAVLLVAAAVWLLVNKPVEGPVLVTLSDSNGITVADVPSVLAVLLALALILRR